MRRQIRYYFFDFIEEIIKSGPCRLSQGSSFGFIPATFTEESSHFEREIITSLKREKRDSWFLLNAINPLKTITSATLKYKNASGELLESKIIQNIKREVVPLLKKARESENKLAYLENHLDHIDRDIANAFLLSEIDDFKESWYRKSACVIAKRVVSEGILFKSKFYGGTSMDRTIIILFDDKLPEKLFKKRYKVYKPGSGYMPTPYFVRAEDFFARLLYLDVIYKELKRLVKLSKENLYEDTVFEEMVEVFKKKCFLREKKDDKVPSDLAMKLGLGSLDFAWSSFGNVFNNVEEVFLSVCFPNIMYRCFYSVYLSYFFMTLVDEYKIESRERKRLRTNESYAKSYMTKKNIPKKIQREMKESDFNQFFDYVEFDEECDLSKVRAISCEYKLVSNKLFNGAHYKGAEIRFRRLGNHKASGLYYPALNCLCVDIASPGALIHENFHLIDYLGEKDGDSYSRRYSFKGILDAYTKLLKDDSKGEKLKGKYNLEYYLAPTEVFARCGEMYVRNFLKVNTSLCSFKENEFGYPADESLQRLINEYYSGLIYKLFYEDKKIAV